VAAVAALEVVAAGGEAEEAVAEEYVSFPTFPSLHATLTRHPPMRCLTSKFVDASFCSRVLLPNRAVSAVDEEVVCPSSHDPPTPSRYLP